MNKDSFLTQSIAGAFGGLSGGIIGQPFDTIKTRLQFKNNISYTNLYKGFIPQVQVQIYCNSLLFGLYEYFKRNIFNNDSSICFKSALITGVIEGSLYSPLELYKTRRQLSLPRPTFSELFKGIEYCILRESLGNCIYFSSYYYSKKYLIEQEYSENVSILTAGGLSGIFYWSLIFPFDTMKTRIQSGSSHHALYKNMYKGLGITVLRAIPVNCATFYAYEHVLNTIT